MLIAYLTYCPFAIVTHICHSIVPKIVNRCSFLIKVFYC